MKAASTSIAVNLTKHHASQRVSTSCVLGEASISIGQNQPQALNLSTTWVHLSLEIKVCYEIYSRCTLGYIFCYLSILVKKPFMHVKSHDLEITMLTRENKISIPLHMIYYYTTLPLCKNNLEMLLLYLFVYYQHMPLLTKSLLYVG